MCAELWCSLISYCSFRLKKKRSVGHSLLGVAGGSDFTLRGFGSFQIAISGSSPSSECWVLLQPHPFYCSEPSWPLWWCLTLVLGGLPSGAVLG